MKIKRQISAMFLAIVMALSLAACGGSETTVVLRGDMTEEMGVPTTDTWTLTAKGDIVQTLKEVFELDLSDYDDETRDVLIKAFESTLVEPSKSIEGVECTGRMEGTAYIIELTVDCSKGDAVKEAADAGLLEIDGSAARISLKQTQESLESAGYEVVE